MGDRYGRRQHRIVGGSSDAGRANDALSAYFEDSEPQRAGGCAGARAQYGERFPPRISLNHQRQRQRIRRPARTAAGNDDLLRASVFVLRARLKRKAEFVNSPLLSQGPLSGRCPPDAVQRVQDWVNLFPRKAFRYASSDSLFRTVLFDIAI